MLQGHIQGKSSTEQHLIHNFTTEAQNSSHKLRCYVASFAEYQASVSTDTLFR